MSDWIEDNVFYLVGVLLAVLWGIVINGEPPLRVIVAGTIAIVLLILFRALRRGWQSLDFEKCPRRVLGYNCHNTSRYPEGCDHSKEELRRAKSVMADRSVPS